MPTAVSGVVWFIFGLSGPVLERQSWIAETVNQCTGRGGALGDNACTAISLSVSRCIGTVVIGEPGEQPERKMEGAAWNLFWLVL